MQHVASSTFLEAMFWSSYLSERSRKRSGVRSPRRLTGKGRLLQGHLGFGSPRSDDGGVWHHTLSWGHCSWRKSWMGESRGGEALYLLRRCRHRGFLPFSRKSTNEDKTKQYAMTLSKLRCVSMAPVSGDEELTYYSP